MAYTHTPATCCVGQVTTTMKFAEDQILAEQVGAAGRALTSASRAFTRVVFPGQGYPVGRVRPKSEMEASAEMGFPSCSLPEDGWKRHVSPIMVAPAELSPFDGTQEQPYQEDSHSVASSLSCPRRGWVSAAGSVLDEAVMARDGRHRGCHLCFKTGHFLVECPLLGSDVRQAAHQQRNLKYQRGLSGKMPAYPSRDTRAPLLTRNQTSNRSMTLVARQFPFTMWCKIPICEGNLRNRPVRRRKTSRERRRDASSLL
jgi:hypothetical protein